MFKLQQDNILELGSFGIPDTWWPLSYFFIQNLKWALALSDTVSKKEMGFPFWKLGPASSDPTILRNF